MKKQPNFAKLFRKHFGGKPAKVQYKVREGSNRYHDLVFLNSLIREASFRRKDVSWRGHGSLRIAIERDCWELDGVQQEDYGELYNAKARLEISPVREVEWRFEHGAIFSDKTSLWLLGIWIDRQSMKSDGSMPVILSGFGPLGVLWQCVLTVHSPFLKIKVRDLEKPFLHSEREKKRTKK